MPYLPVPARNIEIYYEEAGSGDPVVLIGGFTSTIETWALQAPHLAGHFRVIAPDNRGSGRTRVPDDDGHRSPESWAEDVVALLDGLGIERAHLVGCSMGGFIAQAVAVRHGDRLRSLSLLCASPGGEHGVAPQQEVFRGVFAGSLADASEADVEALAHAVLDDRTRSTNPAAWELFSSTRVSHPHSAEELLRRQGGIAGFSVWDDLAGLDVPTLVATGTSDRLVPPENSSRLAARIPGAELHAVDHGGHIFFIEQAEVVNELLVRFLREH